MFHTFSNYVCVEALEELVLLDQKVAEAISSAWASSMLLVRNSQWKRYFQFCHEFGLLALPADASTVACFLVHIGQSVRFSTVNNYTSAVIALHRFYGFEIDFRSFFIIKMVLKGLKVRDDEGSMARVPFSMQQLGLIYDRMVKPHMTICVG